MNPTKRATLFLFTTFFFTGIVLAQAADDNCANVTLIRSDSECVAGPHQLNAQTLGWATSDGSAIASSCTTISAQDAWHKFMVKKPHLPIKTIKCINNIKVRLA